MKKILKFLAFRVLCPLLVVVQFDKLLRLFSSHEKLIIFFHGVTRNKHYHINGRHMDVGQFERLLKYLKHNFDILSVEELCGGGGRKFLSRKAIALSFDDGFLNNIDVALPLLEKLAIPATFFISTASLEDPDYIHPSDLIDLLKATLKEGEISIKGEKFHVSGNELVNSQSGQTMLEYLNSLSFADLRSVVDDIRSKYGYHHLTQHVDPECFRLVSTENLRSIKSNELISVASHGHYHVSVKMLSVAEINEQLVTSRIALERCTARAVKSLAFPYGHFNNDVIEAAEKNGFEYILAAGDVIPGINEVLPRIGVLSMRGYAYNVLSINRAFGRFGF